MRCPVVDAIFERSKELGKELRELSKEEKTDADWDRYHKLVAIISEIENFLNPAIFKVNPRMDEREKLQKIKAIIDDKGE